jgi:methylase of polypeptide subunit release factors
LPGLLTPGGVIALELGAGQHRSVVSLVREQFDIPIDVKLDLHGHKRVILAGGGAVPWA